MSRCKTCEKNARRVNAESKANGDLDGAVETSNGRIVRFSEEERKKRSERAKQLHAQGRLGGRQIGALGGRLSTAIASPTPCSTSSASPMSSS
jgi:hypothetical protein